MKPKYEHIKSKIQNHSLVITLDRPEKKNALNPTMIEAIQELLVSNKDNNSIRVIVLDSSSNIFCAGADLQYLNKIIDFSYEENLIDSRQLMLLFKTMLSYPKLIISKVCGAALGGGCGIVTASDIVFSTDQSSFGYPEVKIGFTPALVSAFLIEKINLSNARRMLLTGESIDAKTAQNIGLINYVCSIDDINNQINTFIKKNINKTAPQSIQTTKQILYEQLDMEKKLERAAELNAKSRTNSNFKQGIQMFLKKEGINWLQT